MKKIPSIFVRDWKGNRKLVTRERNHECDWVFDREGIPTQKWDGTCIMVRNHILYKRYDAKKNKKGNWKTIPEKFELCGEPDKVTGHKVGWIPVKWETKKERKENCYFKMAWDLVDVVNTYTKGIFYLNYPNPKYVDGTYELVGITVNGNPENLNGLYFVKHGFDNLSSISGYTYDSKARLNVENELNYNTIKDFLEHHIIEGIVWHHSDGRMAKIKRTDFGLEWGN